MYNAGTSTKDKSSINAMTAVNPVMAVVIGILILIIVGILGTFIFIRYVYFTSSHGGWLMCSMCMNPLVPCIQGLQEQSKAQR